MSSTPLPVLVIHTGSDTDVLYAGGPGEGGTEPVNVDSSGKSEII
jgi:hypothetical protein